MPAVITAPPGQSRETRRRPQFKWFFVVGRYVGLALAPGAPGPVRALA
ncbi:MAG TPA: hypothetical protein PKK06_08775 [Phycisphaerae bacterium]|nr:hypothetical protein [Phycisphaerae bacterium]HNU45336.1 hypothetical protein [Phycisphaerae bacterium]